MNTNTKGYNNLGIAFTNISNKAGDWLKDAIRRISNSKKIDLVRAKYAFVTVYRIWRRNNKKDSPAQLSRKLINWMSRNKVDYWRKHVALNR